MSLQFFILHFVFLEFDIVRAYFLGRFDVSFVGKIGKDLWEKGVLRMIHMEEVESVAGFLHIRQKAKLCSQ